jgi:hypothetical protein
MTPRPPRSAEWLVEKTLPADPRRSPNETAAERRIAGIGARRHVRSGPIFFGAGRGGARPLSAPLTEA